MKIKVTQKHIEQGEKHCSAGCPVALALKEHFLDVTVGYDTVYYVTPRDEKAHQRALPLKASDFILHFDEGKPVKPFEFTVR